MNVFINSSKYNKNHCYRNGESEYLTTHTIPNNVISTKINILEFLFNITQWRSKNYLAVVSVMSRVTPQRSQMLVLWCTSWCQNFECPLGTEGGLSAVTFLYMKVHVLAARRLFSLS